jgi:hypothetical protein
MTGSCIPGTGIVLASFLGFVDEAKHNASLLAVLYSAGNSVRICCDSRSCITATTVVNNIEEQIGGTAL